MATEQLDTGQVTVTTSATLIVGLGVGRRRVTIKNTHATVTMYAGNSGVTVGNGMEIKAGESESFIVRAPVYGIAASGTLVACYADEA